MSIVFSLSEGPFIFYGVGAGRWDLVDSLGNIWFPPPATSEIFAPPPPKNIIFLKNPPPPPKKKKETKSKAKRMIELSLTYQAVRAFFALLKAHFRPQSLRFRDQSFA